MSAPAIFLDGMEQEHAYDGSEILWRPTIHGLAVQDKKLFVIRPFGSVIFEPPGGKIELGETREDALRREFLEETGYEAEPLELIGFGEKWLFHQREKQFYHMLMQFWSVKIGKKVQQPSDAHEVAEFVPLKNIEPERFHDVIRPVIRQLKEQFS